MNVLNSILALVSGLVVGAGVNMAIVTLGPAIVAPPAGVDVTDPASLAAGIGLFQPRHFIAPFLAHALGTLAGCTVAALVAHSHRAACAHAVGGLFLLGGIAASFMIPAPAWFIALDLVAAYVPMAWLGLFIGRRLRPDSRTGTVPA